MAKTVTIEFTDAQWDLIVNHYSYNKYFDGLPDMPDEETRNDITLEILGKVLKNNVHKNVTAHMEKVGHKALVDSFNV